VENKRYIREKTSEERCRRRAEKAAESEAYWKKVNSRKEQPAEDISNELKDSTTGKLVIGALALDAMLIDWRSLIFILLYFYNSYYKK
jgi:hypothetical protein